MSTWPSSLPVWFWCDNHHSGRLRAKEDGKEELAQVEVAQVIDSKVLLEAITCEAINNNIGMWKERYWNWDWNTVHSVTCYATLSGRKLVVFLVGQPQQMGHLAQLISTCDPILLMVWHHMMSELPLMKVTWRWHCMMPSGHEFTQKSCTWRKWLGLQRYRQARAAAYSSWWTARQTSAHSGERPGPDAWPPR